jgi:hypothetical protein
VCHKFESAAKVTSSLCVVALHLTQLLLRNLLQEHTSTGDVVADEWGRVRVNVTLVTAPETSECTCKPSLLLIKRLIPDCLRPYPVLCGVSAAYEQERRIKQILQGTAIDMSLEEQIAYLSRHVLPRFEKEQAQG